MMDTKTVTAKMGKIEQARDALLKRCPNFPKILVVLGSGLNGLMDEIEKEDIIPFSEIPHVKTATVQGHAGKLGIGKLGGVRVACLQGRLHYYEGHSMDDVVFPFRAMALSGCETFILTNAAGGLDPSTEPPALMLLSDHINMMGTNPLLGPNEASLGARFPDMTHVYDPELRSVFREVAKQAGIPLREGVYLALSGPCYETPSEVRMARVLGGDAVGMSTVPEAIALRHMGKRVVAVSCITNLAAGVGNEPLSHEEVLENAAKAYSYFSSLIRGAVQAIGENDV